MDRQDFLKTLAEICHKADFQIHAYPGSSLGWYLAAREHRPAWMRTGRLLDAHGIPHDTAAGRTEFESRLEERRRVETEDEWDTVRRGWCLGSETFRQELLEKMESALGDHHAGELKLESAAAKAERIIAQELQRLGWTQADLRLRLKGDPAKIAFAARLKIETIMPVPWIAERLSLGTPKSARARLRKQKQPLSSVIRPLPLSPCPPSRCEIPSIFSWKIAEIPPEKYFSARRGMSTDVTPQSL